MTGTPILEREPILASIDQALQLAQEGQGGSLFIIGEAGLGKTTMVNRARARAGDGYRVGIGRGDAGESTLPFGVLDQALRALGGEPAPGADTRERPPLAARAAHFYGVLHFLEGLADRPTLLLLEDLHWADDDSLALLTFLCRRIRGLPIAVIGSLRPWPATALEMVHHLGADGDAILEQVRPLSEQAAAALLAARTGHRVSPPSVRRAERLTAGNPLLLEELAHHLRKDRGQPGIPAESSGNPQARLLLSRFAGVSGNSLQLARSASILGSRFRPRIASEMAALTEAEANQAVEALCGSGLVRTGAGGFAEFAHPMLRQALYDAIPGPVRNRLHSTAFRLLVGHGADPGEAAEHALRADLSGDPQAIAVLEQAGRAALAAGAVARGRQRLQAAAGLAGRHASPELLLVLGEALLVSGDGRGAAAVYRRLLEQPAVDVASRVAAQRMLGRALFIHDQVEPARQAFQEAARAAAKNPRAAVEALLDEAFVSWPTGGPALALPPLERARELARGGSKELRMRAETAWGFTSFMRGDPAGIPVIEAALQTAVANPEADTAEFAWSWGTVGTYGNVTKWTERFADATRAYEIGKQAAEHIGSPVAMAAVAVMHADTLVRIGHLREALELADRATLLADLAPERAYWAAITHAYVLADMGQFAECERWAQRAAGLARQEPEWAGRLWLWHIEAVLAMHARRAAEAGGLFDRIRALASRLEILEPCIVPWAGDAVTAYLYGGRPDAALAVVSELERLAAPLPCRYPRIVAVGSRAALAQMNGDTEATERLLAEAAELAGESGMAVLQARVWTRFGAFIRKGGGDVRARPYLATALDLARSAGAEGVALRAAEELALANGRPIRRRENPDELTPAESRVRRLAEQGQSTRQIAQHLSLSENTIETHLQHMYRKLGVRSKLELVRLALGEAS